MSSRGALIYGLVMVALIIFSIVIFCVQSLPKHYEDSQSGPSWSFWFVADVCVTAVFTIDYIGRVCTAPRVWKEMKTGDSVIDFLSIAPFYLELALLEYDLPYMGVTAIRVLRMARVLRCVV